MCPPRRMLLHISAGCMHCDQNACVGRYYHAAWKDVTEGEQCHNVGPCCGVLIGLAPVNATGCAVRLWSVFPPVEQRGAGEQQGVDPRTGNEQMAMKRVKSISCEDRLSL